MDKVTTPDFVDGFSDEFFKNLVDKENVSNHVFLSSSPIPVFSILAIYLLTILKLGPWFMEGRPPYDLKLVLRIYNVLQVVGNVKLLLSPLYWYFDYLPYFLKLSCQLPEDDEVFAYTKQVFLTLNRDFLTLKVFDLLDTVFFVLTKKNSHITFLHVYHHMAMVFFTWFCTTYIKALQGTLPAIINCVVHSVMYSYYFLSTFGEPVSRYLWWKKHLTKLQLAQFVIILIYISLLYAFNCPISKAFTFIWLFNVFIMLCLFVNFYIKAYVQNNPSEQSKKRR